MNSDFKKNLPWLTGIWIVALVVRLVFIFELTPLVLFDVPPKDFLEHHDAALAILEGRVTSETLTYFSAAYALFLAAVYSLFGIDSQPVVIVQAVLDSLSTLGIFYIAASYFGARTGRLAAMCYALSGIALFYTGITLAPTLGVFALVLAAALTRCALQFNKLWLFPVAGLAFGMTLITRPNLLLLILLFIPYLLHRLKTKQTHWQRLACETVSFGLGSACVVCALAFYKQQHGAGWKPFPINGGINFYVGNHPEATGTFRSPPGMSSFPKQQVLDSIALAEKATGRTLSPGEASQYWFREGLKFWFQSPGAALSLLFKKTMLLINTEEISLNVSYPFFQKYIAWLRLPWLSWGVLLPFAVIGMGVAFKRRQGYALMGALLLTAASVLLFFISARYRLPMLPFVVIFAGLGLDALWEQLQKKNIRALAPLLAGVFFTALLTHLPFHWFSEPKKQDGFHLELGYEYSQQGQHHPAMIELQKAATIAPQAVDIQYYLGLVSARQGNLVEAIRYWKAALTLNPHHSGALDGIYTAVSDLHQQVSAHAPEHMHYQLGMIFAKHGLRSEARGQLEAALSLNPDNIDAQRALENLLQK